jgi:hypothetical protein
MDLLDERAPMESNFELPVNEITVLLGLGAVGIITVISLFLYLVVDAVFGKEN